MPKNDLDKFWSPVLETIDNAFLRDRDNNIIKASARFLRFIGKEAKDVIGKKCYQVMHGLDAPPAFCPYSRMLESSLPESAVAYEPKLDKWLNIRVTPLFNENKELLGSLHMIEDVTARKHQEDELSDSRQAYLNMMNSAHDFIFVIDRSFRVSYVNEFGVKALKKPAEKVVGSFLDDLFAPNEVSRQKGYIRQVLDSGKPLTTESHYSLPDGELWLNTTLSPLFDDKKSVVSVLGISRDVSAHKNIEDTRTSELEQLRLFQRLAVDRELKLMEIEKGIASRDAAIEKLRSQAEKDRQRLEQAEQKYLLLLDSAPVAIIITDLSGRVLEFNKNAQEMSGYEDDECRRHNIVDLYDDPGDRERMLGLLQSQKRLHDYEVRLRHKNSTIYWVLLNIDLVEIEGNQFLFASARDISELKKIRDSLRASEEKLKKYENAVRELREPGS